MLSINRLISRPRVCSLLAVIAGMAIATTASAQECKLGVAASPPILTTGQSASVDVLAHFSPTMYALASAQFGMNATFPSWSFASSGAIIGNNVLGINVSQANMPPAGIFADPANPIRIWHGTFTPTSNLPAFVQISANPSAISVYPSKLTSSSVPCEATGGGAFVLVNPVRFGSGNPGEQLAAAPGAGTAMRIDRENIIGSLVGQRDERGILIGLLAPAVQKVRIAAARSPQSLTVGITPVASRPMEMLSLNFTKVVYSSLYKVDSLVPPEDEIEVRLFMGRHEVGHFMDTNHAGFHVDRIPDEFTTSVERKAGDYYRVTLEDCLVSSWQTSASSPMRVILPDGQVRTADVIKVAARMKSPNNLKQIGLAVHSYGATGVADLIVDPRNRD